MKYHALIVLFLSGAHETKIEPMLQASDVVIRPRNPLTDPSTPISRLVRSHGSTPATDYHPSGIASVDSRTLASTISSQQISAQTSKTTTPPASKPISRQPSNISADTAPTSSKKEPIMTSDMQTKYKALFADPFSDLEATKTRLAKEKAAKEASVQRDQNLKEFSAKADLKLTEKHQAKRILASGKRIAEIENSLEEKQQQVTKLQELQAELKKTIASQQSKSSNGRIAQNDTSLKIARDSLAVSQADLRKAELAQQDLGQEMQNLEEELSSLKTRAQEASDAISKAKSALSSAKVTGVSSQQANDDDDNL